MAAAGAVHARTHASCVEAKIRAGVTTRGARRGRRAATSARRARCPSFKGYRGFPGSICASPNAMVVHGIPGPVQARSAATSSRRHRRDARRLGRRRRPHVPGRRRSRPVAEKLLEVTEASLFDAVEQCAARQPARRRLARGPDARRGGRPLGRALARRPRHRPRDARGPAGPELRRRRAAARCSRRAWCSRSSRWSPPGRHMVRMGDDGWAIFSQDGSLAAHFEFTVAITADGPRILTRGTCPRAQTLRGARAQRRAASVNGALLAVFGPRAARLAVCVASAKGSGGPMRQPEPIAGPLDEEGTMKVRPSVKPMCEKCKIIRRHGAVLVICSEPAPQAAPGVIG